MTIITGNPPWPPEQPEQTSNWTPLPPMRVWRLHIIPGDSPVVIGAREFEDLSREVRAAFERHRLAVPVEYHGAPWIRWMQLAFWGEGCASTLGDWRLVEVCAACLGSRTDEHGHDCDICGGTGVPGRCK